jgi:hypothetical protein
MPGTILGDIASRRWLYLSVKPSHVRANVDGLVCPLHSRTACTHQMRGHGFLLDVVLSRRATVAVVPFQGDAKLPSLNIWWSVDHLGICVIESLHGVDCFYHDMFIRCQSHRSVYVCIPGRATVSDDDGTDFSTWVLALRCTWAPVATSHHARHLSPPLSEALGLVMLIHC